MLPSSEAAPMRGQRTGQPGCRWVGVAGGDLPVSQHPLCSYQRGNGCGSSCTLWDSCVMRVKITLGSQKGKDGDGGRGGGRKRGNPEIEIFTKETAAQVTARLSPTTAAHDRWHGRFSGLMFPPSSPQDSSGLSCSLTFQLKGADVFHPFRFSHKTQLPERVLVLLRCEMT